MKRSREEILEEKKDNFKRLAEARTQKTIDMLRLIGNLSNTSLYSYTDEQVEKVFETLDFELKSAKEKFRKAQGSSDKFTL